MRLLIVGNSVSNPPHTGEPSYSQLLEERLAGSGSVETLIRGGETIVQIQGSAMAALGMRPDYLVLQVGINECAPRPLSLAERARLGRVRPSWLQRQIIRLIHRFRPNIIRARALNQVVPLPEFVATVTRLLDAAVAAGTRVLVLPITSVAPEAESRTPFTNREVRRYNDALQALASPGVRVASQAEVFGSDVAAEIVASPDTVHLSPDAHRALASFIANWLTNPARQTGTR
jgi:lysophospholipase L1-like esterase